MSVVWSPFALEDLRSIRHYVAQDNPAAAARVADRILQFATGQLSQFPRSGRAGRVFGTFELIVPRTPYIVVYALTVDGAYILAVHHGARRWPESF
ncbi:MAG: type II toxin-antitoxin system RelE/ParE family toxin [Rhizobiales bacterium]|nr:type II toxin-antitoxin system RelE/ParE family toxin [Hyphomicrobiales bacterium]